MRVVKKKWPWLISSAVLTFIGYKQTSRQATYTYGNYIRIKAGVSKTYIFYLLDKNTKDGGG